MEDGECKRRDDRGDRMDHPIIGKLPPPIGPKPEPQPSAMPPAPSKKPAGLCGARPSSPSRATQASAPLSGAGAHGRGLARAVLAVSCTARDKDAGGREARLPVRCGHRLRLGSVGDWRACSRAALAPAERALSSYRSQLIPGSHRVRR